MNRTSENRLSPTGPRSVPVPWLRYLAPLSLLGFLSLRDPLYGAFFAFGAFLNWGSENRWLRAVSYLGFLGFLR